MNDNILSTSGKAFQKFICHLTQKLPKPKTKFITQGGKKSFASQTIVPLCCVQ